MTGFIKGLAGVFMGAVLLLTPTVSWALEDGDTVRIVIPYSPGGGYDSQGRLAAPYVEQALNKSGLNNVTVIVENVTGGGGAIATSQVYAAKPDGKTVLFLDPESSIWQQALAGAPFRVDECRCVEGTQVCNFGSIVSTKGRHVIFNRVKCT